MFNWGDMHNRSVDPFDIVRLIDDRYELLTAMGAEPRDKRNLERTVSFSRSTIDRAIRRLEEHGLIERVDAGYRLTYTGHVLVQNYDSWMMDMEPIIGSRKLLRHCPADFDVPAELLRNGKIIQGDRFEPNRAQRQFLSYLDDVENVKGISPTTNEQLINRLQQRTIEAHHFTEIITPTRVVEYLFEAHPDLIRTVLESRNCQLYSYDGQFDYGLAILRDKIERVCVGILNSRNQLRGILVDDSEVAMEWAYQRFQTYKSECQPVSTDGPDAG